MKKIILTLFSFVIMSSAFISYAHAEKFNYVSQKGFKTWLESEKKILICDIQPENGFNKHHFKKAIETNAYPAKTKSDLKKLKPFIQKAKNSDKDIVIICPRGKGGAKRTYSYLKKNNFPEKRLFILEGGANGWPYKEFESKSE